MFISTVNQVLPGEIHTNNDSPSYMILESESKPGEDQSSIRRDIE